VQNSLIPLAKPASLLIRCIGQYASMSPVFQDQLMLAQRARPTPKRITYCAYRLAHCHSDQWQSLGWVARHCSKAEEHQSRRACKLKPKAPFGHTSCRPLSKIFFLWGFFFFAKRPSTPALGLRWQIGATTMHPRAYMAAGRPISLLDGFQLPGD